MSPIQKSASLYFPRQRLKIDPDTTISQKENNNADFKLEEISVQISSDYQSFTRKLTILTREKLFEMNMTLLGLVENYN